MEIQWNYEICLMTLNEIGLTIEKKMDVTRIFTHFLSMPFRDSPPIPEVTYFFSDCCTLYSKVPDYLLLNAHLLQGERDDPL